MHEIKEIIQSIAKVAKAELSEEKNLIPRIILLLRNTDDHLIELGFVECSSFFESYKSKAHLPAAVATVWENLHKEKPHLILECVCMISDTWHSEKSFVETPSEQQIQEMRANTKPSKDPDKREAIAVVANYKDTTESTMIYYSRVNGGIVYEEQKEHTQGVTGTMSNLYPKDIFETRKN